MKKCTLSGTCDYETIFTPQKKKILTWKAMTEQWFDTLKRGYMLVNETVEPDILCRVEVKKRLRERREKKRKKK